MLDDREDQARKLVKARKMARKERVTRVIDGDTFQTASRKRPVRLANVHASETGTRGGAAATTELKKLIEGEIVSIETVARDVYGRSVARVKVGRRSVNKAMREKTKRRR